MFLPRRPQGVAFMFTMANRLPRLTNLTMHDSANMQRCSIDRSVQREFWDAVSPRTETAARLPRQNDSFSFVACVTTKECPRVTAQQERPQLPAAFRRNSKSPRWQQMSPARAWWALPKARYRDPRQLWNTKQHRYAMPAGLPSNETRHSLRQSAQCRQSADTAR